MGLKAIGYPPPAESNGNASAAWGGITGNQADQTDLAANFAAVNSAIALKADAGAVAGNFTAVADALSNRALSTTGVIAGAGLSGGGAIGANVTLTVTYGSGANTAAQGNDARLSDARTPLGHNANHAAAGNDPVDHDTLANFVANKHIDHALTYVVAGTGLTGGGNLAANRTLTLSNTAVAAGNYGNSGNVPVLTVDAQGRITAANQAAIAGGSGITQLTGDVTAGPGSGSQAATLANTAVGAGNYGSGSAVPILTVDAKGRITAANTAAVVSGAPTSTGGVGASPNASGTQQITHGLGRTPIVIRIYGLGTKVAGSSATNPCESFGIWNSSGNFNINRVQGASAGQSSSAAFAIKVGSGATAFCSGVIQNVGATTFDIAWTESGTSDTTPVYLWEAQ